MAFPRALLLSALLGSAYMVKAAPVASSSSPFSSSCKPNSYYAYQISFNGKPLSINDSGKIVVGGNPLNFGVATCSTTYSGYKGFNEYSKGYFVNFEDPSQCITVSHLDQSGATFGFQDCRFNGAGDVWSSQSFAWNFDDNGANNIKQVYFNGENFNNNTSIYTLKAQNTKPTIDGRYGELIADYTPDITTVPDNQLQLPAYGAPASALPPRPASLSCSSPIEGQINFNNQTSSSNGYNGPLNDKWEPQSSTSTKFLFEQCDYSASGLKAEGDYVYGRIRPGTDVTDGGFNCYFLTDDIGADKNNQPTNHAWINGFQLQTCSYTVETGLDLVKFNKKDNTFNYVPFGNGSQPGSMYWYSQAEYDSEYDVTQYQWDPQGVGQVYISPNNANLTKFPPAKVTFHADN